MNRNQAKVVDGLVDAVRELNVGNLGRAGAASASAEHAAGSSRKGAVDAGLESAKIKLELNKRLVGLGTMSINTRTIQASETGWCSFPTSVVKVRNRE
jgi:hypothetical protein